MWGEIIAGVLVGASKAIALWMSGKEDEAKATLNTTLEEAAAKVAAHEQAHAARDADIRSPVDATTAAKFDPRPVLAPKPDGDGS